jgi:ssDNA-binding replication factor A large subunit
MGADKNSSSKNSAYVPIATPKVTHNTNRQDNVLMDQLQVLGTIPRSTRGNTREETKEPIKLGKILCTDQTVRLATADYPSGKERTIQKTGMNGPPYKKHFQPKNTAFV